MAKTVFRKTMEVSRMLCIVTLFSVLFQAAGIIINCKLSICRSNGTDDITPETNASFPRKIDENVIAAKWETFAKECPQMISVATAASLRQQEDLKVASTNIETIEKLNQNAFYVKRYSLNDVQTSDDIEHENELGINKQNRIFSLGSYLNSPLSMYFQNGKESRQSRNEYELNPIVTSSQRLSRAYNYRKLTVVRNLAGKIRNIKQTKKDTRGIRSEDRSENLLYNMRQGDNFIRNSLRRSLEREIMQRYAARHSKFRSKSLTRKNHERRSDVSLKRSEREMELEMSQKSYGSPSAYLTSTKRKEAKNDIFVSIRAQHSQQLASFSSRYDYAKRRRELGWIQNFKHLERFSGKESRSAIVNYGNQNIAKSTKHLARPHANAQASRQLYSVTNRVEKVRPQNLGISNERLMHVQDSHLHNSNSAYEDQHSIRTASHLKIFKHEDSRKIHKIRQFSRMDMNSHNILTSESSEKRAKISQQRVALPQETNYNIRLERFIQRYLFGNQYYERIPNLNLHSRHQTNLMERRNSLFHSQNDHLTLIDNKKSSQAHIANTDKSVQNSRRNQYRGHNRRILNNESNRLTFLKYVRRREVGNQLFGEVFQQRLQHGTIYHEVSPRMQYRNHLRNFSARSLYYRHFDRILHSGADSRKYVERKAYVTANMIDQQRSIRSILNPERPSVRWKQSLIYSGRNLFQDQMPHRRYSQTVTGRRRNENDSQMSFDRVEVHKEETRLSNFYTFSDKLYLTVARSYREGKSKKLQMEHRGYQLTKVNPVINMRRLKKLITLPFVEPRDQLDLFRVKKQTRIHNNVPRSLNMDTATKKVVRETGISYKMHQDSFFQEYKHSSDCLKKVALSIMGEMFKIGNNLLSWKSGFENSFSNNKMKHETGSPQQMKERLLEYKKRSIGIQDVVITGIGIFAAVRLHSTK